MQHLLRIDLSGTVDDQLMRVFVAFDCVIKHLNLGTESLLDQLPKDLQERVKGCLRRAGEEIKKMQADPNGNPLPPLLKIGDGLSNAPNRESKFGKGVVKLLSHLGFHDASVMEERLGKDAWWRLLSKVRGEVIHEGYIEFGKQDVPGECDMLRLKEHLRDILIRTVLKTLGYAGTYQSPIPVGCMTPRKVDWVTPSTIASELGYA